MPIGTGLKHPVEISKNTGQLERAGDKKGNPADKLRQRIEIIINTKIGSMFFDRTFGSPTDDINFEPINENTLIMAQDRLIQSVNEQEPDATVNDMQFSSPKGKPSTLKILVYYVSDEIRTDGPIEVEVEL